MIDPLHAEEEKALDSNMCPFCKVALELLDKARSFIPWGVKDRALVTVTKKCPVCRLHF